MGYLQIEPKQIAMLFQLNIKNTILRFYFMMLVGIAAVYADSVLLILLTFIVGVSAILGIAIRKRPAAKRVQLETRQREKRKAG